MLIYITFHSLFDIFDDFNNAFLPPRTHFIRAQVTHISLKLALQSNFYHEYYLKTRRIVICSVI